MRWCKSYYSINCMWSKNSQYLETYEEQLELILEEQRTCYSQYINILVIIQEHYYCQRRYVGVASRCLALGTVRPNFSVMSKSVGNILFGSPQSKQCTSCATTRRTTVSPSWIPGQPLRPEPNGRSWKSRPRRSMLLPTNLSGIKLSGSVQTLGSLPIAHIFMITCDFRGMWKPLTLQSSMAAWGSNSGATGRNLKVSFNTMFKYSNFSKSDSSTILSKPTTSSNSFWTFFITRGCLMSSESVHSIAVDDVSIAPTTMSYEEISLQKRHWLLYLFYYYYTWHKCKYMKNLMPIGT